MNAGTCPVCQGPNGCRLQNGVGYKGPCWCEQTDIAAEFIAQLPEEKRHRQCFCSHCVAEFNRKRDYRPTPGPGDYYIDGAGRWVFTEAYHRRRGFCCGSGCRHCPYQPTPENPAITA